MYQLSHNTEQEHFEVRFLWKPELETQFRAFQNCLIAPKVDGQFCTATMPASNWNLQTIREVLKPLYIDQKAQAVFNKQVLPVNMPGSPYRAQVPEITDWQFYRQPKAHQLHSFKYAVENPNAALLLEMGLGKTYVTVNVLDYFRKVKGERRPSLIVLPLSCFESWEAEFEACGSDAVVIPLLGSAAQKRAKLQDPADVYLVSYDTLRSMLPDFQTRDWFYIVLDESTKIKNHTAERAKACYDIAPLSTRRIILSGTPITQSYEDVFGQYRFLDPDVFGRSYHQFKSQYTIMGGYRVNGRPMQVVGYQNVPQLVKKMYSRAIRFTKAECLDLPEKVYQVFHYDLDKVERKAYDEMKKELVLEWNSEGKQVTASNALVAGLRLVQICAGYVGGVKDLESEQHDLKQELGTSKMDLLKEVLEQVPKDEHAIVWVRFRHDMRKVQKVCDELGLSYVKFYGDLSSKERSEAIQDFQAGKYKVFIGTLQSGGHGITLVRATYVIYATQDYSVERRLQSEDRAHRIGQKNTVVYIDLVARGTIEESILKCIKGKYKASEMILAQPKAFLEGTL